MKSIELQPNKENLLRTFELDAIERNVDIYRFINLLNAIEDNCSVALDGAWGSGKTFFVKQTKMILDAYNEFIGSHDDIENNTIRTHFEAMQTGMRRVPIDVQPEVSVYYDAWSNDNDIDPMLIKTGRLGNARPPSICRKNVSSILIISANILAVRPRLFLTFCMRLPDSFLFIYLLCKDIIL